MFEANKISEATTGLLIAINTVKNKEARVRLSQHLLQKQAEYINGIRAAAVGQIKETIRAKKTNAEAGLKEVTDMFITLFENMEDNPYMQERAADIRDVTKRVLANLLGKKLPNPASINEESVVIAHDLTPSDFCDCSIF